MAMELHHFFILTEPGAPQADLVSGIGLIEGSRNDHPGQGTANRRFFFSNTALELLYLRDAWEAENGPGSRLRITERVTDQQASPFGIIVGTSLGSTGVPFNSWRYCPEYFPADRCFHVGENSDRLEEPLCICMPLNLRVSGVQTVQPQPLNAHMTLTELRISVPVVQASPTLEIFAGCRGVSLVLNEPHRLELVFNEGRESFYRDMAPSLPVVFRW